MPTTPNAWPPRRPYIPLGCHQQSRVQDGQRAPLSAEALEQLYRGAACECNPDLLADAAPPNHLRLPRRRPAAYLGAAVVLVLIAFALAGCGGGDPEPEAEHDKTTQPVDCAHYPELCR